MRARTCAVIALVVLSCVAATRSSLSQPGIADPERGHELAARLCINCHVIDRQTSSPTRVDVPSFPAIANLSGVTAEHITGRIIVPHPAMPGIPLTSAEIRDIVAYIMSLQRND